jgi:hypothetical protein
MDISGVRLSYHLDSLSKGNKLKMLSSSWTAPPHYECMWDSGSNFHALLTLVLGTSSVDKIPHHTPLKTMAHASINGL